MLNPGSGLCRSAPGGRSSALLAPVEPRRRSISQMATITAAMTTTNHHMGSPLRYGRRPLRRAHDGPPILAPTSIVTREPGPPLTPTQDEGSQCEERAGHPGRPVDEPRPRTDDVAA